MRAGTLETFFKNISSRRHSSALTRREKKIYRAIYTAIDIVHTIPTENRIGWDEIIVKIIYFSVYGRISVFQDKSKHIFLHLSNHTLMKRHEVATSLFIPIIEILWVVGIFFAAYYLRQITDGIPFVQLRIPYISPDQFAPFVISGWLFWGVIFASAGLYRYDGERPLFDTIRRVIAEGAMWFLFYVAFVYLTTGFLFTREIPRLIIGYVWLWSTFFAIMLRIWVYTLMGILYKYNYISKNRILVLTDEAKKTYTLENHAATEYLYENPDSREKILDTIRSGKIDTVLSLSHMSEEMTTDIVELCSIYGVTFSYPRIPQYVYDITRNNSFIGGIPVIESSALAMSAWDRIMKRSLDIIVSFFFLIILSPVFVLIMCIIKIEDSSGPVIYKNRRIWLFGKEFFLYKFRYMYWKYSVKDAYGIGEKSDSALKYEEILKKTADTRDGPLYKIKDDPRKTHTGKWIERLSLDELPQLYNVLRWEMSLVGPRPHQPREVDLYDEHHHQVLTVKPGITGMAQVSWREKNSFEEEVAYDVYYIEHYSILLDFIIILKTIGVVFLRAFR
jgi:exopolysaccharide biosynthesis polyprenyl glycosylphosphotransferase